jgi:hypothetical protein
MSSLFFIFFENPGPLPLDLCKFYCIILEEGKLCRCIKQKTDEWAKESEKNYLYYFNFTVTLFEWNSFFF